MRPFPDIKAICKFAQAEFKFGEVERARTIFEGIVSNYAKRTDLWSIYLDMEERVGDVAVLRCAGRRPGRARRARGGGGGASALDRTVRLTPGATVSDGQREEAAGVFTSASCTKSGRAKR